MGISYYLYKNPPSPHDSEEETAEQPELYHARAVTSRIRTSEDLIRSSSGDSAQMGIALGVLNNLVRQMQMFLREGDAVRIDGLGLFKPLLSLKVPVLDPADVTKADVKVRAVSFRVNSRFLKDVATADFTKVSDYRSTPYTREQRRANILEFLEENTEGTNLDFRKLNQCGSSTARTDVKRLVKEGVVRAGRNNVYRLNPDMQ